MNIEDILKYKKASKLPTEELGKILSNLIMLKTCSQSFHWITKGSSFYSDHLLFAKIYEISDGLIDSFAEKITAQFGSGLVDPAKLLALSAIKLNELIEFKTLDNPDALFANLYKVILYVLNETNQTYSECNKQKSISIGLDDYIIETISALEDIEYLTKQRIS